jgi:hypothetical protein
MMEAADQGYLHDRPPIWTLHESGLWRVLLQREVGSGVVVVEEVLLKHATQMMLVQDDEVIEALPAQGADETLHAGIRIGRRLQPKQT